VTARSPEEVLYARFTAEGGCAETGQTITAGIIRRKIIRCRFVGLVSFPGLVMTTMFSPKNLFSFTRITHIFRIMPVEMLIFFQQMKIISPSLI
jgi:hypothetical protein